MPKKDIIILGAGISGRILAHCLSHSPYRSEFGDIKIYADAISPIPKGFFIFKYPLVNIEMERIEMPISIWDGYKFKIKASETDEFLYKTKIYGNHPHIKSSIKRLKEWGDFYRPKDLKEFDKTIFNDWTKFHIDKIDMSGERMKIKSKESEIEFKFSENVVFNSIPLPVTLALMDEPKWEWFSKFPLIFSLFTTDLPNQIVYDTSHPSNISRVTITDNTAMAESSSTDLSGNIINELELGDLISQEKHPIGKICSTCQTNINKLMPKLKPMIMFGRYGVWNKKYTLTDVIKLSNGIARYL